MRRTNPDPALDELKAAIARRKGIRRENESPDPKKAAARRRIEEMTEELALKERTEWL
jgi:hypothetical protein